jgi:hypothetical protein
MTESIEMFWEEILSRQPERIQAAFLTLSGEEKEAVLNHLKRMTREPGWHPEQVNSAKKALQVLDDEQ